MCELRGFRKLLYITVQCLVNRDLGFKEVYDYYPQQLTLEVPKPSAKAENSAYSQISIEQQILHSTKLSPNKPQITSKMPFASPQASKNYLKTTLLNKLSFEVQKIYMHHFGESILPSNFVSEQQFGLFIAGVLTLEQYALDLYAVLAAETASADVLAQPLQGGADPGEPARKVGLPAGVEPDGRRRRRHAQGVAARRVQREPGRAGAAVQAGGQRHGKVGLVFRGPERRADFRGFQRGHADANRGHRGAAGHQRRGSEQQEGRHTPRQLREPAQEKASGPADEVMLAGGRTGRLAQGSVEMAWCEFWLFWSSKHVVRKAALRGAAAENWQSSRYA